MQLAEKLDWKGLIHIVGKVHKASEFRLMNVYVKVKLSLSML
jgi:hypothetical protein